MKRSLSCLIAVAAGLCGLLAAGPAVATTAAVGDTDSRPAQARVANSPSGQDSLSASAYAVQQTGRLTVGSPRLADRLHRTDPTFSSTDRNEAIRRANAASAATADHLHLGSGEALVTRDVVRDNDGANHVRYSRTFDGMPVIGGDLIVASGANGGIRTVEYANRDRVSLPSTRTTLTGAQAADQAATRTNLAVGTSAPTKVVYAVDHAPVLAWQTTVSGREKDGTPIVDLVYIDARSGKELGRLPQIMDASGTGHSLYSAKVALTTTHSGSRYQLRDASRGAARTYDANNSTSSSQGTLFTDANNVWGDGTTSSRQSAAVDAAYGAAKTWDFYKSAFGRTGIRNNGVAAKSRVHYGKNYENAFWQDSTFTMTYGDGGAELRSVTSLDVAAHEMTHGVTAATDGLVYQGDAGGLNESTSDVMGTMVEFYAHRTTDPGDYYIGEKIMRHGGFLRRMDRPSLDGASVDCWSPSVARLDPHYSSGVGNHLFYLLAEGTGSKTIGGRAHNSTTCNGTTLTGIGRNPAAAIWYRAMTTYWTSTTTYPQAANGMVDAAKDLYGPNSARCNATVAAWQGVKASPTHTCGTTSPPPAGGELLRNRGFESGPTTWTASDGVITDSFDGFPHSGSYYAWLDGYGSSHSDALSQTVTIPPATNVTLGFYLYVGTEETGSTAYDTLKVRVTASGTTSTVATFSNVDAGNGYLHRTVDLSGYAGKAVTLNFLGTEDSSLATSFLIDDTSLVAN